MTTFWQFVVIGLGTGAVYALLALGVVAIYRVSGVVNFAQGAFAVMAGFLYAPLVGEHGWSTWPAFAIVVAGASVAGMAIYWLAIRPLRNASQVTRVIATLAVLLVLQGFATIRYAGNTVVVEAILPGGGTTLAGVFIGNSQLVLVGIAGGLTLLLTLASRFTLAGLATRAVAENPVATAAIGWSPDVLATSSWALGGGLGAAAGMLIAPVTGVTIGNMTLLAVAALAAALAAGFSSFGWTLLAALLIGVGQSEVGNYTTLTGAPQAFPFFALVVVLAVRGRGMPLRGQLTERQADLGDGTISLRLAVPALLLAAAAISFVFGDELVASVTTSLIFAVILLSVVVLTGMTGQLSLAQMAFAGLGALIAARLVHSAGFSFLPAAALAIVATIPIGMLFALPALRTRGMTLAMVTLGLGAAVSGMLFANGDVIAGELGTPVGPQSALGWSLDSSVHPTRYSLLCLAVLTAWAVAVANLRRGRVGRRLIAVRANERAAAALGVNVTAAKLYAFGLASCIAATGGVLLAFQFSSVDYTQFDPFSSVLVASYAVIGGVGFVGGALLAAPLAPGAIGTWLFDQFGTDLSKYLSLVSGLLLLVVLLQNPNGIESQLLGIRRAVANRRSRRTGRRRAASSAALVAGGVIDIKRAEPTSLGVDDLAVHFGGVRAVDGVSLTLTPGRVSGLIGPNGAGKTTVIDAITGFVRPTRGLITLNDRRIDTWPTHRRSQAGVSRSFQALELFEGVTVAENLLSAAEDRDVGAYLATLVRPGRPSLPPAALAAIREFGLEDDLDKLPSELSFGRRRLVAIARAIASQPSVLLLDEPVAGLDTTEATEIAELVRGLARNWGIAVLLVEHDMDFVMSTCDEVTVIDFGRPISHGSPEEVCRDPKVLAAYLGEPEAALTAEPV